VAAIQASLTCWFSVRFSGFFHSEYRAPFKPLARSLPGRGGASARGRPRPRLGSVRANTRASFHASRRTSSSASVAHFTTWNGSATRTAAGHFSATMVSMKSAPSALTWVIWAHRSGPSRSKNSRTVALLRPAAAHTSRRVSWSTTTIIMWNQKVCQGCDETHEKCPRNTLRASRRNARETVSIVWHGK